MLHCYSQVLTTDDLPKHFHDSCFSNSSRLSHKSHYDKVWAAGSWPAISLRRWVVAWMSMDFCSMDVASITMINLDQQYTHVGIIWSDTNVDVIRGALYNGQHLVNYDDIGFFVSIGQIFPTDGNSLINLNWDWIAPCDHEFMNDWW